ncbi:MAG: hypothetical protein WD342_12420 [Verrucomicrobiales bacterium]
MWVWQGQGGEDPSEHAAEQRDALLSRLKDEGGGAAMQSELDSRVAGRFEDECDALFTRTGQVKAGSDLRRAQERKEAAEEEVRRAEEAFAKLEHALRDFAQAESTIASHREKSAESAAELESARAKLKTVSELRHREEIQRRVFEEATARHGQMESALEQVAALQKEIRQLEERMKPATEKAGQLEASLKEKRAAFDEAEKALEKAEQAQTEVRDSCELANAWVRLLQEREEAAGLEKRKGEVEALRARCEKVDADLASLPTVDADVYGKLQRLEGQLSEADAVLRATSTGIEVIRSAAEVKAGDVILADGEEHVIEQEEFLTVGESLEIRISPGGGTGLADAKRTANECRSRKEEAFASAEVETLKEAGEILGKRQQLESRRRELAAELTGKDADEVESRLGEAKRRLAASEAEVKRRCERSPAFEDPASLAEACERMEAFQAETESFQAKAGEAKAHRLAVSESCKQTEAALARATESAQADERRLIELQAQLRAKEEPLGASEDREKNRTRLREEKQQAEAALNATRQELESLQPDTLEADVRRLERAIDVAKQEIEKAGQQKAVASNILTTDGSVDPAAALETARARAESDAERHRSLERRAEAIRLLRDRFAAEQQELSDRFSRPLAEKVSAYLQQVFGPVATASVSVEDGVIGRWRMARDGTEFAFDKLSGGAREQVAGAVRLAMAEILANDFDGTLPVVFDDAFTNADPERVRSLHRMLDLAARHGLQIILLTCNPSDYAALGAHTVSLQA